ncbi:PREDICTED: PLASMODESMATA CALLOSE-BINDING PROTEIN 3-like [Fragaria vesca subsp. vesca]|uniref:PLASMODESMATA CALLOSE-BINDING PROTEIN 3-like n=1 Tax=Fragaria vesca subsp. vesca TaxID=101020 RepID=UPI0002C30D38|nr:PREDICTED: PLASMODESMATA CALLOSE-BINDING PROTEIN 3-like [Fragaria vesca subsp. vesca]
MAALVYVVLFLALTGHSSATYCLCKDGVSDANLQKALDYACGAGADCSPILSSGTCYNPNTIKDHCNWAVNSYFQKKGQTPLSCDFAGTATQSQTPPTTSSTCVYPSSASNSTTNSTTTTPSTTPSTTPTTGTTPTATPTNGTTTGTTTPSTTPSVFGISPTSSFTDSSPGLAPHFIAAAATLCFSAFLLLWG